MNLVRKHAIPPERAYVWRIAMTACLLQLHRQGEPVDPELLVWARGNLERNGYGHAWAARLRRALGTGPY